MKVLLTGASSFTGMWFASELLEAGHEVVAVLRREDAGSYDGIRGVRVNRLRDLGARLVTGCAFGDERFLQLLSSGVDVLCHHGAHVENYKSADFDVAGAVENNSRNLRAVLEAARGGGAKGVVLTGSVFEQDEGAGNRPMRAFSPYGLSKGLTWQVFRYWAETLEMPLHKFVIPNPFGPFEEARFCAYLMRRWAAGEVAQVNTPDYVRDNIHVGLLAKVYAAFVADSAQGPQWSHRGPSGYVESQGAFAARFAREMAARLAIETPLELGQQRDFSEPMVRINRDRPQGAAMGWSEGAAWDALAEYYRDLYLAKA